MQNAKAMGNGMGKMLEEIGKNLGALGVSCTDDGNYAPKQCHASTGFCWCVDIVTGIEIVGTKKRPADGTVTCGMLNTRVIL